MDYPKVFANEALEVLYGEGPTPRPGEDVMYVLAPTDPAAIRQAIPQSNSHTAGDVLGAKVVRCWGPGMVNLVVFVDGPRSWWVTSVGYAMPALVDGLDAAAVPAYEVPVRSWHFPVARWIDTSAASGMYVMAEQVLGVVVDGFALDGDRRCRVCGCTEVDACNPPCSWVEADLCSACVDVGAEGAADDESD